MKNISSSCHSNCESASWLNPSLFLADCGSQEGEAPSLSLSLSSLGMDRIQDAVAWYQKKIGYNDKQLWEQSVEMKLQKVRLADLLGCRLKTEFIDVDLIRGSTFSKAKPKVSWTSITGNAIIRCVLLPVYFRWWVQQSSVLFFLFLLYLYTQQLVTMVVYFRTVGEITEDELSLSEVMMPAILMMVLALIHSQTVVSHLSHKTPLRDLNKLNRSLSKSKKRVSKVGISTSSQKSQESIPSDSTVSRSQSAKSFTVIPDTSLDNEESRSAKGSTRDNLSGQDRKGKQKSMSVKRNAQKNMECRRSISPKEPNQKDSIKVNNQKKHQLNVVQLESGKSALASVSHEGVMSVDSRDGHTAGHLCNTELLDMNAKCEQLSANSASDKLCSVNNVDFLEEDFSSFGSESQDNDLHLPGAIGEIIQKGSSRDGIEEENFADSERISDDIHSDSEHESKVQLGDSGQFSKSSHDLRESCGTELSQTQSKQTHLEITRRLSDLAKKSRQDSDAEDVSENEVMTDMKLSMSGTSLRRRRRVNSANKSADLGEVARSRVVPNNLGLWPQAVKAPNGVVGSSSENETTPGPATPDTGNKVTLSSEEWEDRIQSDVTTSSSYSSSCGSEAELTDSGENQLEIDELHTQGWTTSNLHVINLLQPPTASSTGVSHIPPPDKVSCVLWEGNECKKVDLTALDIGWAIIDKVDNMPESSDYIVIGLVLSVIMACVPLVFRLYHIKQLPDLFKLAGIYSMWDQLQQNPWRRSLFAVNGVTQRLCLSLIFFFLLSVADRTFKQRLLYAKHFCYLTSSRRARKFDMPHFRLSKVRNIKTWLSLRSYLKRRGPQRSVDVIVSATFLLAICIVTLMCLQMLKDAETYLDFECNWELVFWCLALGVYLLRFMTLGLKINKKYRNLSVLITEQINLYLQMEQKPHKKEELMLANNVLKLAEELLKELESPFKISGFSANPLIYNITKVVVLSAFSAVLTELLGFKLKLYKIKFKP
ncbi:LOW QUALITY PROTEIN: protein PHTF1-like [Haliotis rubra]|uniref:LOW QUALITY PROTEIN: protein PHTF1-like n=1 Tax=Haliotis rubra TaxID=36100 RepID=UPI001EE4EFA3|nr:LOW QUALITY PROTEIN: protein PHTF1-like [Haliotis rubra]